MLLEQMRLHGRRLFRIAYGILGESHAAEDTCQQVILKAWELRDQVRDPAALQGWLMRVTVTESLQLVRRRRTDWKLRDMDPPRTPEGMSPMERAEFREVLHAALADLPELTRTVVVLRLIQGMSGNEVKAVLGCSASEVSRRLHHGMEYLRERMARTCMLPEA
jgi:RNA polymerase sigma-70 factor (ECF subfamily)